MSKVMNLFLIMRISKIRVLAISFNISAQLPLFVYYSTINPKSKFALHGPEITHNDSFLSYFIKLLYENTVNGKNIGNT